MQFLQALAASSVQAIAIHAALKEYAQLAMLGFSYQQMEFVLLVLQDAQYAHLQLTVFFVIEDINFLEHLVHMHVH